MMKRFKECFAKKQQPKPLKRPEGTSSNSMDTNPVSIPEFTLPPAPENEQQLLRVPNIKSNLLWEHKDERNPFSYYDVISVLGDGSMGDVLKVKRKSHTVGGSARRHSDQQESEKDNSEEGEEEAVDSTTSNLAHSSSDHHYYYALKSMKLERVSNKSKIQSLKSEVEILKSLDHPHIVRAIETFEYQNELFMVMELCSGGDLYSRGPYTEAEAARIVGSVLSAIASMHRKNMIHRDIKYENILFVDESPKSVVKLIDYGISQRYMDSSDKFSDRVGTIATMAPEVIRGSYTKQADVWSIGVLAYMLLSNKRPFDGKTNKHIVRKIKEAKFDFKGKQWKTVSQQAKDFVTMLLRVDPEKRPTAEEAGRDPWLYRRASVSMHSPRLQELNQVQISLENYVDYSKLKKLGLFVIAHKSTSEEIGILRKVFEGYDLRKDNIISFLEFKEGLRDYGYDNEELKEMFHAIDLDGSGKIRYTEFLAATIESRGDISEERIAEAFDRLDSDDSGYITAENLRQILGQDYDSHDIEEMIQEADLTGDCQVTYPEFLALWDDSK